MRTIVINHYNKSAEGGLKRLTHGLSLDPGMLELIGDFILNKIE